MDASFPLRPDAALMSAIFESCTDCGIATTDPQGRVTAWNPGAESLTGWPAAEMLGEDIGRIFAPEDRAAGKPAREREQALAAGKADSEGWLLRHDGTRLWSCATTMPLRGGADAPAGVLRIFRDASALLADRERQPGVRRLQRHHESQLKALAEASRAILLAGDLDAMLDAITQAAQQLVGAHQSVTSLSIDADWRQAINSVVLSDRYARWRGYDAPTDGSGIYALVTQTNRPVRMTQAELEAHPRWRGFGAHAAHHPPMRGWLAVPMVGTDGRNLGLIQLSDKFHDADFDASDEAVVVQLAHFASAAIEQALAREALRENERSLRLVMDASAIGTWRLDLDHQALSWDARTRELFGVPADRPVSIEVFVDMLHAEDRARVVAAMERTLDPASDGRFDDEYRALGLDGQERWIAATGRVLRLPGEPACFIGTVLDVTPRKRAELALIDADRRKDEFLAMLGHELRNPLAPLTNALRLLERAPRDERAGELVTMAQRQTRQLTRLVDDLLEINRITRGRIELRPERLDVGEALHAAADSMTGALAGRRQRLHLELPDEALQVRADPARVAQVLENLLHNASKYTPEGGQVWLRARGLNDWVEMSVTDDGIGIEPDKIPRLFELFSQIDASLDRAQGGLGIGLALVKRLVEMHGGTVAADSPGPGRGATFSVRLPRLARGGADSGGLA